jgi:hypothetical protein
MRPVHHQIAARLLAYAVLTSGIAFLGTASASAATFKVAGVQSAPVTSAICPDQTSGMSAYTMAGGLVGCWYTDTSVINPAQPNGTPGGTVQATGTEHFVGCLDLNADGACDTGDPYGTLEFSYQFSGKFDPVTGAEIHGRCQHPITSGSGDFAGATGVITFKDDVANGTSLYRGHISL